MPTHTTDGRLRTRVEKKGAKHLTSFAKAKRNDDCYYFLSVARDAENKRVSDGAEKYK